jgi:hypothetical protein
MHARRLPAAVAARDVLAATTADVPALAATLARRYGRPVALTASGREALVVVLRALGVRPPDVVIVSAYNAACVPRVLRAAGYRVAFADIDRETLHVDVATLPEIGARALVAVHMEGSPAPIDAYRAWAAPRGCVVIEDAAHALGARLDGREVGTLADGAILSFGPGKHVNALGGGAAIVRVDAGDALRALAPPPAPRLGLGLALAAGRRLYPHVAPILLRATAADPVEWVMRDRGAPGDVSPRQMPAVSARLALAALPAHDAAMAARRARVAELLAAFSGSIALDELAARLGASAPLRSRVTLHRPIAGAEPAWLELTALAPDRDVVRAALLRAGLDAARTWMSCCDPRCSVAACIAREAMYIPLCAMRASSST